jgi:hypothetical protein
MRKITKGAVTIKMWDLGGQARGTWGEAGLWRTSVLDAGFGGHLNETSVSCASADLRARMLIPCIRVCLTAVCVRPGACHINVEITTFSQSSLQVPDASRSVCVLL